MSAARPARPSLGPTPDRDGCKRRAARAFDGAVRETDATNDAVADALGLGATRVRRYRSDDPADLDATASTADLIAAPEPLFAAWLARLVGERRALHGAHGGLSLERALCAALAHDADVQRVAITALADGAISPHEVPAIADALDRSHATREQLAGLLRARGAR